MLFIYDSQIGMELQFYPSQTKSCIDLFQILFDTPNYQRGWLESLEDKKPWPLMLQFLVARKNMPSLSWRTVSKPYCYIKKDQGYDIFCRQLLSSSACFRKKKDFRRNCISYMFFKKKYIFRGRTMWENVKLIYNTHLKCANLWVSSHKCKPHEGVVVSTKNICFSWWRRRKHLIFGFISSYKLGSIFSVVFDEKFLWKFVFCLVL